MPESSCLGPSRVDNSRNGVVAQVLILRNYGILVCAESIEEAYGSCANVMSAVETQVGAL